MAATRRTGGAPAGCWTVHVRRVCAAPLHRVHVSKGQPGGGADGATDRLILILIGALTFIWAQKWPYTDIS
jgi:hypothetical protein